MSILPYNSSNRVTSTRSLFHGKRLYYKEIPQSNNPNYLDLWYRNPLYGKVDTKFNIIHPFGFNLSELKHDGEKQGINALGFVAEAFNAMNYYMRKLEVARKIREGSFFFPLEAHKGWTSVNKNYGTHVKTIYDIFIRKFIRSRKRHLDRQITNFDDFLPIFVNFLNFMSGQRVPLTKSGYISKLSNPISTSGLAIEVASEPDFSNDQIKYKNYFSDSQYSLYLDLASKFGFYVDMNVPWRLVANLKSPAWQQNQYLRDIIDVYFPKGYDLQVMFDGLYHKSYLSDVPSLKVLAMQFYNSLVSKSPTVDNPDVCPSAGASSYTPNKIIRNTTTRQPISAGDLEKKYGILFWLRLYMQLRLKEMELDISEHQIKHEMKEIEQHHTLGGYELALEYIGQRTAHYLRGQMEIMRDSIVRPKLPLTSGKTPDIIL